jgi:hypothetical protein
MYQACELFVSAERPDETSLPVYQAFMRLSPDGPYGGGPDGPSFLVRVRDYRGPSTYRQGITAEILTESGQGTSALWRGESCLIRIDKSPPVPAGRLDCHLIRADGQEGRWI